VPTIATPAVLRGGAGSHVAWLVAKPLWRGDRYPHAVDDETAARFDLLKIELATIQGGIRGIDSILFQVKGWCVTVCVAVAGVALSQKSAVLTAVAGAAVVGFWLVDAHYKSLQRVFITRDNAIEDALKEVGPLAALRSGSLRVPATASRFRDHPDRQYNPQATRLDQKVKIEMRLLWAEARLPLTFGLYVVLGLLLGSLALVITLT
jgi:hypothetical protein